MWNGSGYSGARELITVKSTQIAISTDIFTLPTRKVGPKCCSSEERGFLCLLIGLVIGTCKSDLLGDGHLHAPSFSWWVNGTAHLDDLRMGSFTVLSASSFKDGQAEHAKHMAHYNCFRLQLHLLILTQATYKSCLNFSTAPSLPFLSPYPAFY